MLSVEMKVNGSLVAHVYAHNAEILSGDLCRYPYEIYTLGTVNPIHIGSVRHFRKDGLVALVHLILEDYLDEQTDLSV